MTDQEQQPKRVLSTCKNPNICENTEKLFIIIRHKLSNNKYDELNEYLRKHNFDLGFHIADHFYKGQLPRDETEFIKKILPVEAMHTRKPLATIEHAYAINNLILT